jgi:hypothetical protein
MSKLASWSSLTQIIVSCIRRLAKEAFRLRFENFNNSCIETRRNSRRNSSKLVETRRTSVVLKLMFAIVSKILKHSDVDTQSTQRGLFGDSCCPNGNTHFELPFGETIKQSCPQKPVEHDSRSPNHYMMRNLLGIGREERGSRAKLESTTRNHFFMNGCHPTQFDHLHKTSDAQNPPPPCPPDLCPAGRGIHKSDRILGEYSLARSPG